jgi:hypothetical protein
MISGQCCFHISWERPEGTGTSREVREDRQKVKPNHAHCSAAAHQQNATIQRKVVPRISFTPL